MRSNNLLRAKRNLEKGDKVQDLNVKGNDVTEVTEFFMELFSGSSKKEHHNSKSKLAI